MKLRILRLVEPSGASLQELTLMVPLDDAGRMALRAAFLAASARNHDWVYRSHFFLGLVSQDVVKRICADREVDQAALIRAFEGLLPAGSDGQVSSPSGSPELAAALKGVRRAFSLQPQVSTASLLEHFLRGDHEFRETIGVHNVGRLTRPHGDTIEIPDGVVLKVRLFNDNATAQEFVVSMLVQVVGLTPPQARRKMLEIDTTGSSVVLTGPRTDAIRVAEMIGTAARLRGFPLGIRLEA
jgi:ATP-dependent Clp protease adapter protein ClpS